MALSGSAARRYAEALLALSPNERAVADLRTSLEKLAPVFDRATVAALRDPSVPMKQRLAALSAAVAGEPAAVGSLMVLLLESDRIALVPQIALAFGDLVELRATFAVDPTLIGGAKVQIGDHLIDSSVHAKLIALGRQLAS